MANPVTDSPTQHSPRDEERSPREESKTSTVFENAKSEISNNCVPQIDPAEVKRIRRDSVKLYEKLAELGF